MSKRPSIHERIARQHEKYARRREQRRARDESLPTDGFRPDRPHGTPDEMAMVYNEQDRQDRMLAEAWLAEHWDTLPDYFKEGLILKAMFSPINPAPPLWWVLRANGQGPWAGRRPF